MTKQDTQVLYDLLKCGISAEDLTKALNEAQKRVDAEAAEEKKKAEEKAKRDQAIKVAREYAAENLYDWLCLIANLDAENYEKDTETLTSMLKNMESYIKTLSDFTASVHKPLYKDIKNKVSIWDAIFE